MKNVKSMKSKVIENVEKYVKKFNEIYGTDLEAPPVEFSVRGCTSGKFSFDIGGTNKILNPRIKFNPDIMEENFDEFYKTVIHEVAHFTSILHFGPTFTRTGRFQQHGKFWKSVMQSLGVPANRCHSYSIPQRSRRKQDKWIYACACNDNIVLSTTRHNRANNGKSEYRCTRCKQTIKFVKQI